MQMKDKGLDELKMIVVDDDDEEKVSNHWNEDFSSQDNKTVIYY